MNSVLKNSPRFRIQSDFVALALIFVVMGAACDRGPVVYTPPAEAVRVGILSKYAPAHLDLFLTTGRIFANGETITIVPDEAAGALSIPGEDSALRVQLDLIGSQNSRKIRVRIDGNRETGSRNPMDFPTAGLVIDSPTPFEIQLPEQSRRPGSKMIRRRYTGRLEITAGASLATVVTVPLERYVRATARAELGALLFTDLSEDQQTQLRQAMETAVRSYALAHLNRHDRIARASEREPDIEFADLCDLTHCMHFPGLTRRGIDRRSRIDERSEEQPRSRLQETRERLLLVYGRPESSILKSQDIVPAYFHSTCGGRMSAPEAYWPTLHRPELAGVFRTATDVLDGATLCSASPHFRWRARVKISELRQILPGVDSARAIDLNPLRRVAGRVMSVRTDLSDELSAQAFVSRAGRALGWNVIKSNDFTIEGSSQGIEFRGRGLGHGVGLCQWGAREQARRGRSAREILRFYYPGARLLQLVEESTP